MKIAVVGAGITGITTAYSLAKRGHDVVVFDENEYPAMKTSYANGGQLSVSNSDVWTTWDNIGKATKWLFKKDAPLLINLTPSYSKYKWLFEFLKATADTQSSKNATIETIKLGLKARELYFKIAEEENIKFDLKKEGILHFFTNEEYFNKAKISCEQVYKELGVQRNILTKEEVFDIEPSLNRRSSVVGGTYTPHDASGDIHKFCIELSIVLAAKYNVRYMFGVMVDTLELAEIYDHVVVCAGVYSKKISDEIKDPINVYPVKGYSITIDVGSKNESAPSVSLLDDEAKIVASRLGSRLRVAGTAEISGYNYDIRHDRVQPLIDWVTKWFPHIRTEHVVPWAGLRPMTPNMLPIVRRSKVDNIWYNTGHGHLGWTLSAATAEIIAENINNS